MDGGEESTQEDFSTASKATDLFLERLRVRRHQSVLDGLLEWIKEGNTLERRQIKALFTRLEWQKKFVQALEVSEWLMRQRPFELMEIHYALWLYYVGKVHGLSKAEESLLHIPLHFQKEVSYSKLFDLYLEDHKYEEARCILKRMKEQGVPVPTYFHNCLITFCDRNALEGTIPALLVEMKEQNIAFNIHTYNILLGWKAQNSGVEGLEEVWGLMKENPSVKPDCVTYSTLASAYIVGGLHDKAELALRNAEKHVPEGRTIVKNLPGLILLYGALGKGEDVERLYKKIRDLPRPTGISVFVDVMEAFGQAACVESAEQVMQDMVAERGWQHLNQYNTLLGVYCRNGLMEKAEEVLRNLIASNHRPNALTYSYLLLGYLKTDQPVRAMKYFELVLTGIKGLIFNWEIFVTKAWLHNARSIIELFARKDGMKHVELLLNELEAAKFHKFPKAYNSLRKAYKKSFGVAYVNDCSQCGAHMPFFLTLP